MLSQRGNLHARLEEAKTLHRKMTSRTCAMPNDRVSISATVLTMPEKLLILAKLEESFMHPLSTRQINIKRRPEAYILTANTSSHACPNISNNFPFGKTSSPSTSSRLELYPFSRFLSIIQPLNIRWWRTLPQ